MTIEPIVAAGGVVVRAGQDGTTEVLVVHRPKYDDWSLPKGKEEPGEDPSESALREVREETGHRARIVDRLPDIRYTVGGRPKLVRWFLMRASGTGTFTPNEEVDEVRWVTVEAARDLVDYPNDRDLLADPRLPGAARSGTVHLWRHAAAGSRDTWDGDDELRPLTGEGRLQSQAVAARLADAGVDRILTSRYVRCVQTVEPLAALVPLPIEVHPLLAEGADAAALGDLVAGMAGHDAVMCSHGDMIPAVLEHLSNRGVELRSPTGRFDCRKGSVWTVEIEVGEPKVALYSPPPAVEAFS